MTHSILNYYIGKGIIGIKLTGESVFRDVGAVPEFEFTPEIEQLEHESHREGTRVVDRTVVLRKTATVRIVMEEWVAENLALAVLGTQDTNTDGDDVINILAASTIEGELQFTGTNDIGRQVDINLLQVSFIPGSSITPISEEWGQIEITGTAYAVNGEFGTITVRDNGQSS